jgi:PAS domain S-box-containing protein
LETGEIEWAGAIKEVTGYDPEEFKMFNVSVWLENVHPDDRTRMLETLRKSFEKKEKFKMEFRFRKKDGSYIYIEERVAWLKDENGQSHRALGVMDDVTEWKRAVEKIQISERKYRSFIQNFQGIAFQIDENLNLTFVHGAVEKITGYTEEEFISVINWQDIIYPEDRPIIFKKKRSKAHTIVIEKSASELYAKTVELDG